MPPDISPAWLAKCRTHWFSEWTKYFFSWDCANWQGVSFCYLIEISTEIILTERVVVCILIKRFVVTNSISRSLNMLKLPTNLSPLCSSLNSVDAWNCTLKYLPNISAIPSVFSLLMKVLNTETWERRLFSTGWSFDDIKITSLFLALFCLSLCAFLFALEHRHRQQVYQQCVVHILFVFCGSDFALFSSSCTGRFRLSVYFYSLSCMSDMPSTLKIHDAHMYLLYLSWLDSFYFIFFPFAFCSQESVYLMPCRGKNHLVFQLFAAKKSLFLWCFVLEKVHLVFEHTEFHYSMISSLWCGIPGLRHNSVTQHCFTK